MTTPGAVLDIPGLGVRIEMRRTAAETGGELVEGRDRARLRRRGHATRPPLCVQRGLASALLGIASREYLSLLRPAFRLNHAWAIARARERLEPYARAAAAPAPTTAR